MITFEAKRKIHTVATLAEELTALIEEGFGERYVLMPMPEEFGSDYDYVFVSRGVGIDDATQQCVYLRDVGLEEDIEISELLLN